MSQVERFGVESYFGISDFTRNTKIYETTLRNLDKRTADYGRSVERNTTAAEVSWQDYTRLLQRLLNYQDKELMESQQALARFAQQSRQSSQAASNGWKDFSQSLAGQAMRMRATIDSVRFAFQAFTGPFKAFIAMGTEATGLQRTQQRFRDMVGGAEEYTKAMEEMRVATRGTISDTELISSAFTMLRREYADTAVEAALLARNISLTAKMAGQVPSPEAAMQVFALMMANQSKMRLDAFGLSIEQVDRRIDHLKDTMKLTQEEAFKTAVIQLLDEQVEELGLTAETSVTQLERMRVQFKNIGDNVKTLLMPIFGDFVDILSRWSERITVNMDAIRAGFGEIVGRIRGATQVAGDHLHALVLAFMSLKEAVKGNTDAARDYWQAAGDMYERARSQASLWESVQYEIKRHTGEIADETEESADRQVEALAEVEQAYKDLEAAQAEYQEGLEEVFAEDAAAQAKAVADSIYAIQDAALEASRRREDIARQTAGRIEAIEQTLAASIAKAMQSYHDAIAKADQQLADSRIRIEEDYQRRKRDIMRRYEVSEAEAIRNRDALALVSARRQRDRELREAEEQRDDQAAKAEQAYRRQIQAVEQALERQRLAAQEAYDEQIRQLQASLAEEEAERERSARRTDEDADRQRAREEGKRKQALGQKIADVYLANAEELNTMSQHYNMLTSQLRQYYSNVVQYYTAMAQIRGGTTGLYGGAGGAQQYQHGGYAGRGTYELGEAGREYVIDSPTVQMLEQAFGGAITKSGLTQMAQGRRSPMEMMPATVSHTVNGDVSGRVEVALTQAMDGLEGRLRAAIDGSISEMMRVV
jgi:hypothetical protein